jgi:predicted glycosyltransferase
MEPAGYVKPLVKIALYCHNGSGFGHIIRSIRIAGYLKASGNFAPMIITGCRVLEAIPNPENIPVHRITPVPSDFFQEDRYRIITERMAEIRGFIDTFQPDMLLVDTFPLGYMSELREVLNRSNGSAEGPMCILGIPYVTAELQNVFKSPTNRAAFAAYRYGVVYHEEPYDPVYEKIPFPLEITGIVPGPPPPASNPASKTILVLAGGGATSSDLLDPLIAATATFREQGYVVRFVIGPLADHEDALEKIQGAGNFEIIPSSPIEDMLPDTRLVIARCGYNTAVTLVRTLVPIIFIPFCITRADEQYTRAEALSELKNIAMVDPLEDDIPKRLEQTIATLISSGHAARTSPFSFSGGEKLTTFLTGIANQYILSK